MAGPFPSIQSFYQREMQEVTDHAPAQTTSNPVGDGFTEEELTAALDPLRRKWNPAHEYEERDIGSLSSGPKAVKFVGRIVNFNAIYGRSPKHPKATGWHYMLIKDNSGAISVKLYFASVPYPLRLGQLVSIWTAFIADASQAEFKTTALSANIFPGRVTSDHIMIYNTSPTVNTNHACRRPLEYNKDEALPGLMTLEAYMKSGHDGVVGAKILVCVKSIGARKKISRKTGGETELMEVILFDHTRDVKLKVWGLMVDSARDWDTGRTILLMSNPAYRVEYRGEGTIAIQAQTMVDIDPEFPDAYWLRRYAANLTKRESLGIVFPERVWDIGAGESGISRILFNIADVDEWARSSPRQIFTGLLNITIIEIPLVLLRARNMLMCTEHCGVPIFCNNVSAVCAQCQEKVDLRLNPKIIGKCVDETGCIEAGKLLWSDKAWQELFGRSVQKFLAMTAEEIRLLEQRMVFLRCHLVFGWSEDVGRLAILGVKT